MNIIKCVGLEIYGLVLTKSSTKQIDQKEPLLQTQNFVVYRKQNPYNNFSLQTSLEISLEMILQNCHGTNRRISICEVAKEECKSDLTSYVSEILSRKPYVSPSYSKSNYTKINGKYDVILIQGLIDNSLVENLTEDGFIIYKRSVVDKERKILIDIVFHSNTTTDDLFLLRKPVQICKEQIVFVNVSKDNFKWLEDVKGHMKDENAKVVYLVSQSETNSGIIGLTNCLNKEPSSCKFKFILSKEKISLDDDLYNNQLRKNLVFNIFRDGNWGTYVYLPMEKIAERHVNNAAVHIRTVGDLGSLVWVQSPPIYNE